MANALYDHESEKFNLGAIMALAHHWAKEERAYQFNQLSARHGYNKAAAMGDEALPRYAGLFAASLKEAWALAREQSKERPLTVAAEARIERLEQKRLFYNVVSIDGSARSRENAKRELANISAELASIRDAA